MKWIDFYNTLTSKSAGASWNSAKSGETDKTNFELRWGAQDFCAKICYSRDKWHGSFLENNTMRHPARDFELFLRELSELGKLSLSNLNLISERSRYIISKQHLADGLKTQRVLSLGQFVEIIQSVFQERSIDNIVSGKDGYIHLATLDGIEIGLVGTRNYAIHHSDDFGVWNVSLGNYKTQGNLSSAIRSLNSVLEKIEHERSAIEILAKSLTMTNETNLEARFVDSYKNFKFSMR